MMSYTRDLGYRVDDLLSFWSVLAPDLLFTARGAMIPCVTVEMPLQSQQKHVLRKKWAVGG